MQRFFLNPENFTENTVTLTDINILHQILRVLRMHTGDQCVFLDNSGLEFLSKITELNEKKAVAKILEKRKNACEPEIFVILFQAMPKKPELFELVLQKGTEIGVSAFVPLITERTEREQLSKRDRLEKIIREAAEQSERGKTPSLSEPIIFEKAVMEIFDGISIILHSRGNWPNLSSKLAKIKTAKKCRIFIGPEGGFSEKEIKFAEQKGFFICSLGSRILRTETAAIVAGGLVLNI
ncbi:16S rRNA (uracil(1498)-N(3))-methyltransferase [Candidatus Peregrinibacteria bacterium]|nr:16S rRNA (uracil(1498)-N(3))-methyltransferase [Candidatus Peregrinibacteria bacterium]